MCYFINNARAQKSKISKENRKNRQLKTDVETKMNNSFYLQLNLHPLKATRPPAYQTDL